ncbi:right-handed parallel beta-helix repeat-containing protein [Streptomyces xantholiticus]|uniref:right-handed parallel beta-helix repeat-containing protein n=1 Tax=Streptomyces xantholiticus TaxID=68285 RepID=UPI001674212A|nr:right-handed parallel beta-helix repeat-containing protein [Streptomyces xantholiticus]
MTKRQTTMLGCAALLVVSGLGAAAPARAAVTHQVQPGESIQAAVDAAKPGDTIDIAAGTFTESVRITKSDLTLRGRGGRTVLKPSASAAKAGSCAAAGNGICVLGTEKQPVQGVEIRSLTLSGFDKSGVWAARTDRLTVRQVTSENNGTWGIAQERSTRSVLRSNLVRGNGDAGIFVANTVSEEAGALDTRGTVVSSNLMVGNRIGTTVRRVRNLTVQANEITGNCAGAFLVGDETTPRAGALTVRYNHVHENNKHCDKTARLPEIQGTGIVLTGTEDTLVEWNVIRGNVGAAPMSGGIVLFKSIVGAAGTDNVVRNNVVLGNGTADLANRDAKGTGNLFAGNMCRFSEPAGLC